MESGLKNVAQSAVYMFEEEFQGEYFKDSGSTGIFGEEAKPEAAMEILEKLKEISGADITIFYKDARIATTIYNKNGKPIIFSTFSNSLVTTVGLIKSCRLLSSNNLIISSISS